MPSVKLGDIQALVKQGHTFPKAIDHACGVVKQEQILESRSARRPYISYPWDVMKIGESFIADVRAMWAMQKRVQNYSNEQWAAVRLNDDEFQIFKRK